MTAFPAHGCLPDPTPSTFPSSKISVEGTPLVSRGFPEFAGASVGHALMVHPQMVSWWSSSFQVSVIAGSSEAHKVLILTSSRVELQ